MSYVVADMPERLGETGLQAREAEGRRPAGAGRVESEQRRLHDVRGVLCAVSGRRRIVGLRLTAAEQE